MPGTGSQPAGADSPLQHPSRVLLLPAPAREAVTVALKSHARSDITASGLASEDMSNQLGT